MSAVCLQALQFKSTAQAEMIAKPQQAVGQQCIINSKLHKASLMPIKLCQKLKIWIDGLTI
jgi:hypothetical protein